MKVILKPIQFTNYKDEIEIKIDSNKYISELVEEVKRMIPNISNLDFMFRGKKLISNKTLEEQGIKDSTKLMMYQSNTAEKNEQDCNKNKEEAKISLYKLGYNQDIVESVVKTIPNIDNLTTDLIIEKSLVFLKSLTKETVKEYTIEIDSSYNTIQIDEDKITTVFALGDGVQGQLGVGKYVKSDFPIRVNSLRTLKIKSIACGVSHTAGLTVNGYVYYWGRYYWPKTFDKNTGKEDYKTGDFSLPQLMESLTNELIIEIGCGSNHSLAINDKGEIFTWGEGLYGQLGHGVLDNEFYPRKVSTLKNLRYKFVKGGGTHSIAITHNDLIFGWGSNEKNQLNMKAIKICPTPFLLPIYELLGNYTIEEIKNFNLDESILRKHLDNSSIRNMMQSQVEHISIEGNKSLETKNEISFTQDDLMKVKLIDCGTWFTVMTSQIFPNILYIFGQNFKKVVKITFFEEKKLEIKQISSSNYHICVLTSDDTVYRLNVNTIDSEVERLNHLPLEIEKIGCGYNYLVILTRNKQAIYNVDFEKNNFIFLNSEIRTNISDFATGSSHLFLISSLNDLYFGNYLFEKLYSSSEIVTNNKNFNGDIHIGNEVLFPCHSFILEQFIKKDTVIKLSNENTLIFLELIYTSNLKLLSSEESKKIIEKPEILENLLLNLREILSFINLNKAESSNANYLIELINFYCEKIREILNYERISNEYENLLINKKLTETCNLILNNIVEITVENNLKKLSSFDMNDENNIQNDQNYFKGKGTKVNMLSSNSNESFDYDRLNIKDYLKTQNELIDYRYKFNLKIIQTKENLNKLRIEYIKKVIKDEYTLKIKNGESELKINKLMLCYKSLYFENLIKSPLEIFNFNTIDFGFKPKNIEYALKYFSSEIFYIPIDAIFELLEISSYFMIDNLSSLLEIELEGLINLDNVLCLLEVSRDFSLNFLKKSCLLYLMINLAEAKNKSLFKYIKDEDKSDLKNLLNLNNKN